MGILQSLMGKSGYFYRDSSKLQFVLLYIIYIVIYVIYNKRSEFL